MILNDPVYGTQKITDPCALAIIATPQMQRLKGVNQYGILDFFNPNHFSSRFDHCVGVYLLLRYLSASKEEQLAGLMHDIAHTAFSHVVDYVFGDEVGQSVHETFHHKVIEESDIPAILERYGFDPKRVSNESLFGILERGAPDLCADRVDYLLRDCLCVGLLTKQQVDFIFSSLLVHENEIILNNKDAAKLFADAAMKITQQFYGNTLQAGSFCMMGDILNAALTKGIITKEDFFLTDNELITTLERSGDSQIIRDVHFLKSNPIQEGTKKDHTFHTTAKARYIDPKVLVDGKIERVSEFVEGFKKRIEDLKEMYKEGFYVKVSSD